MGVERISWYRPATLGEEKWDGLNASDGRREETGEFEKVEIEVTGISIRESLLVTLTGDMGEAIDLEMEGLFILPVVGVMTRFDIEESDSVLDEIEPC